MRKKFLLLAITVGIFILVAGYGCQKSGGKATNNNPCGATFVNDDMKNMLSQLKCVDDEGYLYELQYTYDYYSLQSNEVLESILQFKSGCSAFTTYNADDDFILARNYDYNHLDNNHNSTGLNVIVKTAPQGKLKSIAMCDAFWLNPNDYFNGALSNGTTDISNLVLSPYMCVDGMNEAGVSAALLALDTKEGETFTNQNTGKQKTPHFILLRNILDNASSLENAIEIANSYDIVSISNQDLHLIVADKDGNSAVLEWRQYGDDTEQKLYVTYTNAVTNFLVGFNDAEDMYYADNSLREKFSKVENTVNKYTYGYGHGYHRFNGIVSAMDRYINENVVPNKYGVKNATMLNSQAFNILSVAGQEPGLENTSLTQYSALFNMSNGSLQLCSQRDYSKVYSFSLYD